MFLDDIGQNRGIVATRLLLELNPEVRGDCVDEKPDQILLQRPDFFKVTICKLLAMLFLSLSIILISYQPQLHFLSFILFEV